MGDLDRINFDVGCPKCGYPVEISLVDVRLESRIFCPNCKSQIQIRDAGGSAHAVSEQIQNAVDDLANAFRQLGS